MKKLQTPEFEKKLPPLEGEPEFKGNVRYGDEFSLFHPDKKTKVIFIMDRWVHPVTFELEPRIRVSYTDEKETKSHSCSLEKAREEYNILFKDGYV